MVAPEFDIVLGRVPWSVKYISVEAYSTLIGIYDSMCVIQPGEYDEYREIWFELNRGSIDDYGDYEELKSAGEVNNQKEFRELWQYDYPHESKWYNFSVSEYDGILYFYIDKRQLISIPRNKDNFEEPVAVVDEYTAVAGFLLIQIREEVAKLLSSEIQWNRYLEENLSYDRRYGRIKRKVFWDILGEEAIRQDHELGEAMIEKLATIVSESRYKNPNEQHTVITEMTANQFLHYCELGYDANNYFSEEQSGLSPKEKYRAKADGRHDGLLDIDGDSPEAFLHWLHHEQMGGHPWEICRGGNSTHISLFARDSANGWRLTLAGSSIARVVETVRIAIALNDNNIPFTLHEGEAILRMVTGEDYIGIVPKEVFPRYCHGFFPKEDQIIDFMNLPYEYKKEVQGHAFWYPLAPISLVRAQ